MKSSKPSDIFKSFKDLKFLLDKKALSTTRRGENDIEVHRVVKIDIKKESQLFFGCNGWCKTVAVASLSLQNRYSKPKFSVARQRAMAKVGYRLLQRKAL